MNLDLERTVKNFGRAITSASDGRYKIEGEPTMSEEELREWIARQSIVQCPHCGSYRRRS